MVGAGHLAAGLDFHFGKGRRGNADLLRALGPRLGFTLTQLEQVTDPAGSAPFSSSAIRSAWRATAPSPPPPMSRLSWSVLGTVTAGDGRGRTIGFPTANLALEPGTDTARRHLCRAGARCRRPGAAERHGRRRLFGSRPTFEGDRRCLEVHLLDFSGDLYGRALLVEFVAFIRPDRAFQDAASLAAQIALDCDSCATAVAVNQRDDPMRAFPLGQLQAEGKI